MRELHLAGAQVYICRGSGRLGAFHAKGIVIDRRFLYNGSANITDKSECNEEFCFKLSGKVVLQVLERLAVSRHQGTLWKGE